MLINRHWKRASTRARCLGGGEEAAKFKVINIWVKGALRVGVRTRYGQLSEHIAICTLFLTRNICPRTIFPSFAYPIYTYYLYMKLHAATETDGRRYFFPPGALNRSKLGALRPRVPARRRRQTLILNERGTEVKKWNLPFRKKSGGRE